MLCCSRWDSNQTSLYSSFGRKRVSRDFFTFSIKLDSPFHNTIWDYYLEQWHNGLQIYMLAITIQVEAIQPVFKYWGTYTILSSIITLWTSPIQDIRWRLTFLFYPVWFTHGSICSHNTTISLDYNSLRRLLFVYNGYNFHFESKSFGFLHGYFVFLKTISYCQEIICDIDFS